MDLKQLSNKLLLRKMLKVKKQQTVKSEQKNISTTVFDNSDTNKHHEPMEVIDTTINACSDTTKTSEFPFTFYNQFDPNEVTTKMMNGFIYHFPLIFDQPENINNDINRFSDYLISNEKQLNYNLNDTLTFFTITLNLNGQQRIFLHVKKIRYQSIKSHMIRLNTCIFKDQEIVIYINSIFPKKQDSTMNLINIFNDFTSICEPGKFDISCLNLNESIYKFDIFYDLDNYSEQIYSTVFDMLSYCCNDLDYIG